MIFRSLVLGAFLAALGVYTGCTDEQIIFKERPFFEDPPAGAAGFLGYDEEASTLTVCGNCHIGQQSKWAGTAHAGAWATMQASAGAAAACEDCHAVSERGNPATGAVAWSSTGDARYHDVQCESCHGPGSGHVANPDASQPLASIEVGEDFTNGCGECHRASEGHNPFIEEWSASRHGFGGRESLRERDGCKSCHEGKAALAAFGLNVNYVERNQPQAQAIVCAVCHDPHSAANPGQLRFAIGVPDVNQNLCMKCHQKRAVPDLESPQRGPHSPQGPLLLGEEVGWRPPGFEFTTIRGSHGSSANERLCATCHVNPLEFTDPLTGATLSTSGHRFRPIPCLDGQGVPTESDECELSARSFASCTGAGCHRDETAARSVLTVKRQSVGRLVDELDTLLGQLPETEFDRDDGVFTTAEGALFNQRLAEIESSVIHNPFMTEALLLASITAVENEYGVSASIARAARDARLAEILEVTARIY